MDNVGHPAVIQYLGLKGLSPEEIYEDMIATLGEHALCYSMMKKWAAEFKCGTESLEDDHRPGRPPTAASKDTNKIHDMIIADR